MEVLKNKDIVKKVIDVYFDEVILIFDVFRYKLLKSVDEKMLVDIDFLKDKENIL